MNANVLTVKHHEPNGSEHTISFTNGQWIRIRIDNIASCVIEASSEQEQIRQAMFNAAMAYMGANS